MSEQKISINVITVGVFLLFIFLLGFLTRREVVNRKEIRDLRIAMAGEQRLIRNMEDVISLQSDTILNLRGIISSNTTKISALKKDVQNLNMQLKNKPILPPNESYTYLQSLRPDSLEKGWVFSGPQVVGLYDDEYELSIKRNEIPKYESIVEMLVYNVELLEKTDSARVGQLETCLAISDEYRKISELKDKEIEKWQKRGRGRITWALTSTGVATGLFLLLLF